MISILDIQRNGFLGKIVYGETCIHWEYNTVSRCQCEAIGVVFDHHEIIGKIVNNFELIDNKNHVSLIFNFDDNTSWGILFYNDSVTNCYTHYLEIFENGKLVCNFGL